MTPIGEGGGEEERTGMQEKREKQAEGI